MVVVSFAPSCALSPGKPAVIVRDVHKWYRVYASPTERIKRVIGRRSRYLDIQALDHINLEVAPGTAVGIIGENGAGKSTLMKIIAGTTSPTVGTDRGERYGGRHSRTRRGLPPGVFRPRQRGALRRVDGFGSRGDGEPSRRYLRLCRARRFYRASGQELLHRDGHAARLCGRHPRQSRCPGGGRGARGRRRLLSEEVRRQDSRDQGSGNDHRLLFPRHVLRDHVLRPRALDRPGTNRA